MTLQKLASEVAAQRDSIKRLETLIEELQKRVDQGVTYQELARFKQECRKTLKESKGALEFLKGSYDRLEKFCSRQELEEEVKTKIEKKREKEDEKKARRFRSRVMMGSSVVGAIGGTAIWEHIKHWIGIL